MTDIRLYLFQAGRQRCMDHHIWMNQGTGALVEIPVPWFLLVHPKGNTIIDGGLAVEGLADPRAYWGSSIDAFEPVMSEEEGCITQLGALGIDPGDIRFVALSHLHSDHTGGIGRFPNATHIVQRSEYEYANNPDWFVAGAYVRKDFDRPHLNWHFLKGDCTDFYDVYGDGVLQAIFTPGHSVGHQSFLVTLPNQKAILIAADAAYTLDHWNERALPALMSSAVDTAHSVRKLRALADRTGALVVPGHDPNEWSRFRLAPAYLD
ncbi:MULTISPECIES: AttM family quorum-quenching N-acyl homoserine lactonase [Agrobacterium]|jgi:N-acyl homoserine lactone hydrolase|uniref:quorum-quenching N-acyl-homoserine lactonase n=1 Tax=Agrobacterium tumefaciens TaxID=358 RepID=A0AAW8M1R3_AGRTU|nr:MULTISPECIES: N-acyl homoserine lactonase family protein [Agrobacterium]MBP2511457.1 glyoxylase-like metal-dependent hydrolase (beta-lactamase superfamily II) [Agrobacterium tumefaciens]MBP2519282.1 glyoxylase-like metal-dependent hydrolase (beta-lactamase superfamily II) [Agrobacterium tumefaciens]MBP2537349.1 glyoxylase-like metal-dependent hydrolase (beta-lactamase superfamily II) [Agrobacterium tumefaciens]MBP2542605.1 glyoxylase-like metal-dependent hydrolase (beta-lactamase superfamily